MSLVRALIVAALGVASSAGASSAASPVRADARGDRLWTHPSYVSFGVDRIAVLPAVTFDANLEAEKLVERSLVRMLGGTAYRWVAPTSTRNLLRVFSGGDSTLDAVRRRVLERARVDSLDASRLCARLRCDAVLSVQVSHWERREIEWNQSGKPSTTVRLELALVDSTGTLLWTADGAHTAEGPYHSAEAAPLGVTQSGLDRKPITGQGGAPSFSEVLDSLVDRWVDRFPAHPAASRAPADTAATGKRD